MADEIAEAGAPCSTICLIPRRETGGTLPVAGHGSDFEEAGVRVAFHIDDWITILAIYAYGSDGCCAGTSRQKALEGRTLAGAELIGLDQRIGSLEAGKDADFIVLDGDPLSIYTKVLQTYVEGQVVFDRLS